MSKKAVEMSVQELAKYIDYSVLKPEFNEAEIREQVQLSVDFDCKTVCINPWAMDIAKEIIEGSDVELCVCADFPFGTSSSRSRLLQVQSILEEGGVKEVDIVLNYGKIRSGRFDEIVEDLRPIAQEVHKHGALLKCIFESDSLTRDEIRKATEACVEAGADFTKTSTGFYTGTNLNAPQSGGFREMIEDLINDADGRIKVKASGAIRDRQHFLDLIDMGVDRMGVGYKSVPVVLGLSDEKVEKNEY